MVLLADSHMTMVVGVDVHATTAPPFNPIHPYIGMIMDVADYIPFLGTIVSINGLKRGVSDTGGMVVLLMHPTPPPERAFREGIRMSPKDCHLIISNRD